MKILHILTTPRAEGTPRLVLDWLKTGIEEQHVLFLKQDPDDLLQEFKNITGNITIQNVSLHGRCRKFKDIVTTVKKTVKDLQPDMVISWNQGYANWIILGSRLGGCKKNIVHVGCAPEKGRFGYIYDYYVYIPVAICGGKAVCASQYIKSIFDSLFFFPRRRFRVIPNCVNFSKFLKENRHYCNNQKAVLVANLEHAKDHKILIDSWKLVTAVLPEATLSLVGRGSLHTIIQKQIDDLQLTKNVFLLGPRSDVNEILWEHSLFVFSSNKNEGFGTVLIEALASCLQVVSFAEPAPKEVLKDGEYGILVYDRSAMALCQSIIKAFENPLDQIQINKQVNYSEGFKSENMIRKYIEFVNEK